MNDAKRNYFLSRISQDMSALAQSMLEVADSVIRDNINEQEQLKNGEKVAHSEISPAAITQWSAYLCAIQKNLLILMAALYKEADDTDAEMKAVD